MYLYFLYFIWYCALEAFLKLYVPCTILSLITAQKTHLMWYPLTHLILSIHLLLPHNQFVDKLNQMLYHRCRLKLLQD